MMEQLEEEKMWVPRVINGGKGPAEPPSDNHNWLSEFPIHTTFVCRDKRNKDVDLNLYHVAFKTDDAVLLAWRLPDGKMLDYYVDPVRFSQSFEHVTVLGNIPVAEEQEEEHDSEQRNHSRLSDMVLHEAVQGVDQVVSEPEEPNLPHGDCR